MYHVLCCDETLCLPGSVGCPLNPVERLLVLPFSRFLQFSFLDSFTAEPQNFLCSFHILPRKLSVLLFYDHACPIAVFAHVLCYHFHEISSCYETPISLVYLLLCVRCPPLCRLSLAPLDFVAVVFLPLHGVQHWVSVAVLNPRLVWLVSSRLKYSSRLSDHVWCRMVHWLLLIFMKNDLSHSPFLCTVSMR